MGLEMPGRSHTPVITRSAIRAGSLRGALLPSSARHAKLRYSDIKTSRMHGIGAVTFKVSVL